MTQARYRCTAGRTVRWIVMNTRVESKVFSENRRWVWQTLAVRKEIGFVIDYGDHTKEEMMKREANITTETYMYV